MVGPAKPDWAAGEAVHVNDAALELELDCVLVTELMVADVIMVECSLDECVLIWLLETDVLELDGMLEAELETEALTVECILDDCMLLDGATVFMVLELPDGTVE